MLARMEVAIDPDRIVGTLSVAEQQLVEIAKALAADASMIILDEPTTALGSEEIALLHALLRRLRARGSAILYISHRLDEVVELVDRVTILKDGRVASHAEESEIAIPYIVRKMVGDISEHYPKQHNAKRDHRSRGSRHPHGEPRSRRELHGKAGRGLRPWRRAGLGAYGGRPRALRS